MKKKMSFTNFVLVAALIAAAVSRVFPALLFLGAKQFLEKLYFHIILAICVIALIVIALIGCNKPDEMERKIFNRSIRLAFFENIIFLIGSMLAVTFFPNRFHNDVYHFGSYILYVSFFGITLNTIIMDKIEMRKIRKAKDDVFEDEVADNA